MIVQSGLKSSTESLSNLRNILCTKISLQGISQIVLILILHSLFAHAEASLTYNSLFDRCFVILLYKFSNEV